MGQKLDRKEWWKIYSSNPDVIAKRREYMKQYGASVAGKESKKRYNDKLKGSQKAIQYRKKYNQDPLVKERKKRYAIEYYNRKKESIVESRLKRKYGLNKDGFNAMLLNQGNCCAICHEPFDNAQKKCVDHDHSTGKVRGIVHDYCNAGIGLLRDNPKILERAAAYVRKHSPVPIFSWKSGYAKQVGVAIPLSHNQDSVTYKIQKP